MTARPGSAAVELLRYSRAKHVAHAVKVVRQDGQILRLTDHDRTLSIIEPDGATQTYTPIAFGSMSNDRREAAFRAGSQELTGLIDGATITIADLDANRYRGAEVFQLVLDWERPWIVYARHRRFIRAVKRDGSSFVGTLEGRTQALERPTGGRFGGTFTPTCTYELGDPDTCKANITADVKVGVVVQTVIDDRRIAQFTLASWSGAYIDEYYRDGSLLWTTGANAGDVSAIVSYTHATRECSLLIPTTLPIQVGDEATASPGCDGLISTCRDKFSNQLNFGQDPFSPSASQIIEPPDVPT